MSGDSVNITLPFIASPPPSLLVALLMTAAVFAQGLQSVMRFCNKLCIGYFAARCRASITALIHSKILSMSFSCASRYKAGELSSFSVNGTKAIQSQIETISDLVINFLMSIVYFVALLSISPSLLIAAAILACAVIALQRVLEPKVKLLLSYGLKWISQLAPV